MVHYISTLATGVAQILPMRFNVGIWRKWKPYMMVSFFGNKNIQNVLLVLVSTLLTLFCVELGIRFKAYLDDRKTLESLLDRVPRPADGEEAKLGQMIILSENEKIIYKFHSDIFVHFMEQPVHINVDGFRGEPVPKQKEASTVRIIGIGDSQMFGWG